MGCSGRPGFAGVVSRVAELRLFCRRTACAQNAAYGSRSLRTCYDTHTHTCERGFCLLKGISEGTSSVWAVCGNRYEIYPARRAGDMDLFSFPLRTMKMARKLNQTRIDEGSASSRCRASPGRSPGDGDVVKVADAGVCSLLPAAGGRAGHLAVQRVVFAPGLLGRPQCCVCPQAAFVLR